MIPCVINVLTVFFGSYAICDDKLLNVREISVTPRQNQGTNPGQIHIVLLLRHWITSWILLLRRQLMYFVCKLSIGLQKIWQRKIGKRQVGLGKIYDVDEKKPLKFWSCISPTYLQFNSSQHSAISLQLQIHEILATSRTFPFQNVSFDSS